MPKIKNKITTLANKTNRIIKVVFMITFYIYLCAIGFSVNR
jgi:hypothetical protein